MMDLLLSLPPSLSHRSPFSPPPSLLLPPSPSPTLLPPSLLLPPSPSPTLLPPSLLPSLSSSPSLSPPSFSLLPPSLQQ